MICEATHQGLAPLATDLAPLQGEELRMGGAHKRSGTFGRLYDMIRKTLITLSLISVMSSLGLWAGSYFLNAVRITPSANTYWLGKGCIGRSRVRQFTFRSLTLTTSGARVTSFRAAEGKAQISASDWIGLPTRIGFSASGRNAPAIQWEYAGFKGLATRWTPALSFKPFEFIMPLWMPVVVFAAIAWWGYFIPIARRRKRRVLGLCVRCGYDLRGSKDRCPECGRPFEACATKLTADR